MNFFHPKLSRGFDTLLAARERELCEILAARESIIASGTSNGTEVHDFKDAASEESLEMVDAMQAEHAALELEQVLAARRRLQDNDAGDIVLHIVPGCTRGCADPVAPRPLSPGP